MDGVLKRKMPNSTILTESLNCFIDIPDGETSKKSNLPSLTYLSAQGSIQQPNKLSCYFEIKFLRYVSDKQTLNKARMTIS